MKVVTNPFTGKLAEFTETICNCECHRGIAMLHFFPCCQNGIIEHYRDLTAEEEVKRLRPGAYCKLSSDYLYDILDDQKQLNTYGHITECAAWAEALKNIKKEEKK